MVPRPGYNALMKSLISLLLLTVLFACAKKNPNYRGNTVKELIQQKDALMASVKKTKSFPFLTKNIDINFPNADKKGKMMLIGEDAKAAFQALRITSQDINDSEFYESMNQKKSNAITCLELVSIDPDEATEYNCELSFTYNDGAIKSGDEGKVDETIPVLEHSHDGFNLSLDSHDPQKGIIRLKENSALALFSILEVIEEDIDRKTVVKKGKDYVCKKVRSEIQDDVVTCEIRYNPETGKILEEEI